MPGIEGRLPTRLFKAPNKRLIASTFFVML
jgi:hypothetical protein